MRVAVSARVSTHRQAQTHTIAPPRERVCAHLHAHGWPLAPEAIVRDDGYRGAPLARPGVDRLRARVARAEVDRVLIMAPDRLARTDVQHVLRLEALARYGCQLECLDRPMRQDPHEPWGLQIRGAVSEDERSWMAERLRRGRQGTFRAGLLWPWTRAPYGDSPGSRASA